MPTFDESKGEEEQSIDHPKDTPDEHDLGESTAFEFEDVNNHMVAIIRGFSDLSRHYSTHLQDTPLNSKCAVGLGCTISGKLVEKTLYVTLVSSFGLYDGQIAFSLLIAK